jgi:hypothetical protein
MKTNKPGVGSGLRSIGGWVLGLVLGFALVSAPLAAGEVPAFNLAQKPPGAVAAVTLPSENTAVYLCVLGSVAAIFSAASQNGIIYLTALGLGPSLGFFYGGCWGRGLLTATLRVGVTFGLLALAYSDEVSSNIAYVWLGAMVGSALIDVATVRGSVRRHNARVMARQGLTVDVSPFALPKGGGVQVRLGF